VCFLLYIIVVLDKLYKGILHEQSFDINVYATRLGNVLSESLSSVKTFPEQVH